MEVPLAKPPRQDDSGPGVPEALPRTLQKTGERLGTAAIDRLWIFPPLVQGRLEWGLVAASCFEREDARRLVTAAYSAERTGKGLYLDVRLLDRGVAPADRLPRVMRGVAERAKLSLGPPRLVEIGGGEEAFDSLMSHFAPELLSEPVAGAPARAAV